LAVRRDVAEDSGRAGLHCGSSMCKYCGGPRAGPNLPPAASLASPDLGRGCLRLPPGQRADVGGLVRPSATPGSAGQRLSGSANVARCRLHWAGCGSVPSRESRTSAAVDRSALSQSALLRPVTHGACPTKYRQLRINKMGLLSGGVLRGVCRQPVRRQYLRAPRPSGGRGPDPGGEPSASIVRRPGCPGLRSWLRVRP